MSASLASRLRSGYAWALFTAILLPLVPVAFCASRVVRVRGSGGDRLRSLVARWLSAYALSSPLYSFHVEGRENLPTSGAYVLVANHESGLDVLCLFLLGSPARFLALDWVLGVPVVGRLFRWCEHIAMDATSREGRAIAMRQVHASLARGTPVAIFPEGRIPDPEEGLAEFRAGAFRAARENRVPVVPVVLSGTGKAWAPRAVVVEGRHEIYVKILPAVDASLAPQTPEQLTAAVREQMGAAAAALRRPADS
jgi:1-acyl-sn-glycerol-3-phosphate acyltransferase